MVGASSAAAGDAAETGALELEGASSAAAGGLSPVQLGGATETSAAAGEEELGGGAQAGETEALGGAEPSSEVSSGTGEESLESGSDEGLVESASCDNPVVFDDCRADAQAFTC